MTRKERRRQKVKSIVPDNSIVDKKFAMRRISPITYAQEKFFDAYESGKLGIGALGTAGTGKTYVALYLALKDVLENGNHDKVIIIRSAVQSREQGFMGGDLKEKEAHYESPYADIFGDLFDKKDAYSVLKNKGTVEFKTTSFIRGLTWDNAVVVVDESQNCNYEELRTIITRVGENSRIIFCGDKKQDDLHYLRGKEDVSGLPKLTSILNLMEEFEIVNFTVNDVVRSGLVKSFIIAEETQEAA